MTVAALVDRPLLALRAALDELRAVPAPLGGVPTRLAGLRQLSRELRGEWLRLVAEADATGEAAAHGLRGTADLLAEATGAPVAEARAEWARAVRFGQLPGLLDALADGRLDERAARLLLRAWLVLPVRYRDDATAAALLVLAGAVDHAELERKVTELVSALQPEVTDEDLADARESAELTLTAVGAQVRLAGHLDAVTGEWLRDVLQARAEADRASRAGRGPVPGDLRAPSAAQRRAQALVDVVRAAVESGAVPQEGGVPSQVVVVATVEDLTRATMPCCPEHAPEVADPQELLAGLLEGVLDGTGTAPPVAQESRAAEAASPGGTRCAGWSTRTRGGVPLGPRALGALVCCSSLTRLVLSPAGHPLDSSPSTRQLSRRERRALEHRADYRCQRSGCGRPASCCVPHHVVPWALGGPSTQANTVLLCPACHHQLHDRGTVLSLTDGRAVGPRGWVARGARGSPEVRP